MKIVPREAAQSLRTALRSFAAVLAAAFLLPGAAGLPSAAAAPGPDAGGQSTVPPAGPLAGDPARGRLVFGACRTCHYPDKGAGHQNGPSLWNVFGRTAGTQEGFAYYSAALKASGLVWTPEYLDAWLADPRGFIPGTTMMTLGVPDPQARADLIAYLMQYRESP